MIIFLMYKIIHDYTTDNLVVQKDWANSITKDKEGKVVELYTNIDTLSKILKNDELANIKTLLKILANL